MEKLNHAVEATIIEVLASYQWTDYRNFVGFTSGVLFEAAIMLESRPTFGPRFLGRSDTRLRQLQRAAQLAEANALGPPLGVAGREVPSVEDAIAALGLPPRGALDATDWDRQWRLVASNVAVGLQKAAARASLRDAQRALVIAARAAGLDRGALERAVRPWRIRDGNPDADRALAFEAALDADARHFAYQMFDKNDHPRDQ